MDEGRIEELVLHGLIKDLDLQLAGAVVFINGDAALAAVLAQVRHVAQRQRVDPGLCAMSACSTLTRAKGAADRSCALILDLPLACTASARPRIAFSTHSMRSR